MSTNILGLSFGHHDAACALIQDDTVTFAAHAERYSGKKFDKYLNDGMLEEALRVSGSGFDKIAYYERPLLKKARQLLSGEIFHNHMSTVWPSSHIRLFKAINNTVSNPPIYYYTHHKSHAAAGFQTSGFNEACVVVVDAIGEFDCTTIWHARYHNGRALYKKLYSAKYPKSLGLLYSAFTERCGLKPMDEEYILMGMAAYGGPKYAQDIRDDFLGANLHRGIGDWKPEADINDLAASVQYVLETEMMEVFALAKKLSGCTNVVFMGGVALNCVLNTRLANAKIFDRMYIMPNPGDAGSALGAAALAHGGKITVPSTFLGTDIEGDYPVKALLDELLRNKIVGVANGRAEYGPRALGNRSLLADPRGPEIKDKVNEIKRRQQFRPFAPVILEEHLTDYFYVPSGIHKSTWMQYTMPCKRPMDFPAIIHKDGTSRVQTVGKDDNSGLRKLLEQWYQATGCPMLLNTSLNIRGMPMVNDEHDAQEFEVEYGVKVCLKT
jgi:carbamoyltransferase